VIYPFTKRFFVAPQFFLGLTFSWGIPMAFAATVSMVPPLAWILYAGTFFWIVVYDTQYGMVDKEDDLKIGLYSTAILFGKADGWIIGICQLLFVGVLLYVGWTLNFSHPYYFSLGLTALLFLYQQFLTLNRTPDDCFKAFLNNQWVGMVVFLGILNSFN
jgi:4-hydroxybenzoate polyprenyltransferase